MMKAFIYLASQEAKAALNSATSLCKWFDSDQAKDMVEGFNKALKTSLKECIQNAVQCGHSALVVVISIPRAHFITSIQSKLDTSKLGGVRTSKEYY